MEGGAEEGTPRAVKLPAIERLASANDYALPSYVPIAQGGALAANDDYHCFVIDPSVSAPRYITGYEIRAGTAETVHHVMVSVVDPAEASDEMEAGRTNAHLMAQRDGESPDEPGCSCFGVAGDGVSVRATPVVWAPGQGVVRFPGDSGVLVRPTDKLVVQVHYNLADPKQRGRTGATVCASAGATRLGHEQRDVPDHAVLYGAEALAEAADTRASVVAQDL